MGHQFGTVLADPPWQFINRTGKVAPEHKRLSRYATLSLEEIASLPVRAGHAGERALYLWSPNALLPDALPVMEAWGFTYKTNLVWHKVRKDGGPDGRGVGFYFRNVTELILFGVKGRKCARSRPAAARSTIRDPQARALPQARRAVRDHRGVQSRTVPRIIRARHAQGLGGPGEPGDLRITC